VTESTSSRQSPILDVDLPAFETGSASKRSAIVDGTMRSLATGFVYVRHDLSEDLLDDAYGRLADFFALPQDRKDRYTVDGANGQTGYTGLLVETAAVSDVPDWKEMLNWSAPVPIGHPLRHRFPHRYGDPTLPDDDLPGTTEVLMEFHRVTLDLQRRVLRILAVGLGVDEGFFDAMLRDGAALTRALHYPSMDLAPGDEHVWAAEHGDINLITALPRATAPGLQVKTDDGWIPATPPDGHVIVNTGIMLDHLTNGLIPPGIHRVVSDAPGERHSVVQFCHPTPWTMLAPLPTCVTPENPLRYPTISASDRLEQVIWEINLVEAGRRVDD
jgi:isopenicillin N synthase-like dioxygenase|tara:strand:+ start:199 stop:1188 length:990 start_codon:yes stop_codon:yes gene_type:complete